MGTQFLLFKIQGQRDNGRLNDQLKPQSRKMYTLEGTFLGKISIFVIFPYNLIQN